MFNITNPWLYFYLRVTFSTFPIVFSTRDLLMNFHVESDSLTSKDIFIILFTSFFILPLIFLTSPQTISQAQGAMSLLALAITLSGPYGQQGILLQLLPSGKIFFAIFLQSKPWSQFSRCNSTLPIRLGPLFLAILYEANDIEWGKDGIVAKQTHSSHFQLVLLGLLSPRIVNTKLMSPFIFVRFTFTLCHASFLFFLILSF